MSLIPDKATFQKNFAALPLSTYQAGETVIADGSRTGRLLILKKGTVAILKEGTEIAKVAEPGAVFGELSVLLDQPHAADVRALETSEFQPTRRHYSRKIRSRYFTSRQCSRSGSTAPTTLLFN
jgi:CRP/FNR family transcriptional regulator, cyclic AMP receptor protein